MYLLNSLKISLHWDNAFRTLKFQPPDGRWYEYPRLGPSIFPQSRSGSAPLQAVQKRRRARCKNIVQSCKDVENDTIVSSTCWRCVYKKKVSDCRREVNMRVLGLFHAYALIYSRETSDVCGIWWGRVYWGVVDVIRLCKVDEMF